MSYTHDFNELVKQFTPLIYKMINKYHIIGYDKDDLKQECLMVLHKCNETFDDTLKTKFITYFYTNMKNMLYNLLKHSLKEKNASIEVLDENDVSLMSEVASGEEAFIEDLNEALAINMLQELTKMKYGYITYEIIYEGKSYVQIGKEHNFSKQYAEQLHKRNIKALKEIFN